jgi:hypothetical protein
MNELHIIFIINSLHAKFGINKLLNMKQLIHNLTRWIPKNK